MATYPPQPELLIRCSPLDVREIGPWMIEALNVLPEAEAESAVLRLELATHEIAMNIVNHAGLPETAEIRLRIVVTDEAVEIGVVDTGLPFDSDSVETPTPGIPQIRGYGLVIVHKLVDNLDYRRVGDINHWSIRICRSTSRGLNADE